MLQKCPAAYYCLACPAGLQVSIRSVDWFSQGETIISALRNCVCARDVDFIWFHGMLNPCWILLWPSVTHQCVILYYQLHPSYKHRHVNTYIILHNIHLHYVTMYAMANAYSLPGCSFYIWSVHYLFHLTQSSSPSLLVLQVAFRCICVCSQIKGRAICNPNTLQPSVGSKNFSIPAVTGIVCHLCGQMLAEPNVLLEKDIKMHILVARDGEWS